ncbi:MAG: AFG1 family ATPase [Candidatus Competibacteraceae bacterium]|nr:AFG1 family ATPase [Candidatus Competibacteraceae bacterium]
MPLDRYQDDLKRPDFKHDPAQEQAILKLQRIKDDLALQFDRPPKTSLLARWFGAKSTIQPVRGLYLWGGVGRGKTYLMDVFFSALPFDNKLRLHFHRFMKRVHDELRSLRDQQNPLTVVADRLAAQTRIICLDEFFVTDITDAMILAGLLQGLFERGVTLVTTSNIQPDNLYHNGLQRARFLPAIELIKTHMDIYEMDSGIDYRLRFLESAELYHFPLDSNSDAILDNAFTQLAPEPGQYNVALDIEKRSIPTRRCADGVVWFEFADICEGPRSQTDYIEISRLFHSVLIGNIPVLNREKEDPARRFLNLVDEFYDRSVKLIITADAGIDDLYQGQRLQFEYQRTISRLTEMQSHDYLAREHLG